MCLYMLCVHDMESGQVDRVEKRLFHCTFLHFRGFKPWGFVMISKYYVKFKQEGEALMLLRDWLR